jgi:predicted TIM-barrel fold metal-dependent hydrolase
MVQQLDKPTARRTFPILSADSHFTEPADLWTKHIDPAYADRAPHVESRADTDVIVCDSADMFPVGVIHGVRYKGGDVKVDGRYADVPSSGWDPAARIPEMQRDGIAGEVLYPTIAMRFFTIQDLAFQDACIRAYNDWAAEFSRSNPSVFKAIGIVSLDDIDAAIREMRRFPSLGLKGAMIAVFPDGGKAYHDEQYTRFWAEAESLNLPVSLHIATERRVTESKTPTDAFLGYTLVQRTFIGMIYAGVFDTFPRLQVVSVENDAGWAGNIIERMDYVQQKARARNLQRAGQVNKEAPSHYWRTNISYTFMRDRTAILARDIIGVDRLMWSSDFPHGDSTWPDSQAVIDEQFEGVSDADQRAILHDNAARMYGLP